MIIGMDFGTTNSGMSVYDGDTLQLIPLDPSNRNNTVVPTALYITNDRAVHIGKDATNTYYEQNLNRPSKLEKVWVGEVKMTFAEVGTFYRDVYIDKDIYAPGRLFLSFKMGLSSPTYLGTIVGNQYFLLEDIIATYLYATKHRAEQHLGCEIDSIVFGRPVRYSDEPQHNDIARDRMIQAAFKAGYKIVYLQYEPIAAAFYYEMGIQDEQNVLIFDFGGGTLDLSIVNVGNPKTRRVIANGGIPIAGDVFDQRIVRAKYPRHFGEGSQYQSASTTLTVPSSFYNAFSDWQSLLTLQSLDTMERLKQIENTSQQPHKIAALRHLITGHYGLQMYDVAENAKRDLSSRPTARLDMQGEGFKVFDTVTRREFERLIRGDVRAIEERLDDVLNMAGLSVGDIDAVIRTGGSSQIPVFADMLEQRFGANKVRDIDTFGSVTSGLGVIGHQIEQGNLELTAYHADDYASSLADDDTRDTQVPLVDLDVVKRVIDVQETDTATGETQQVIITRSNDHKLHMLDSLPEDADKIADNLDQSAFVHVAQGNQKIVLMTTDYACYVRTASDIAALRANNLHIENLEGFRSDKFSTEMVNAIADWHAVTGKDFVIVMSTLGYTQKFFADKLLPKLDRAVMYQIERKRGYPAFLIGANKNDDLIAISHAGRAVRMSADALPLRDNRLLNLPLSGNIIGMFSTSDVTTEQIFLVTASGYAKRVSLDYIPRTTEMNTTGTKIMTRTNPIRVIRYQSNQRLWVRTEKRIVAIDHTAIPLDNLDKTAYKVLKLSRGESITALITAPV
ncbi:MAG: Hsp70 family protein [Chloroflexota bacterium]